MTTKEILAYTLALAIPIKFLLFLILPLNNKKINAFCDSHITLKKIFYTLIATWMTYYALTHAYIIDLFVGILLGVTLIGAGILSDKNLLQLLNNYATSIDKKSLIKQTGIIWVLWLSLSVSFFYVTL